MAVAVAMAVVEVVVTAVVVTAAVTAVMVAVMVAAATVVTAVGVSMPAPRRPNGRGISPWPPPQSAWNPCPTR